jgi:hypothetical protein
LRVHDSWLASQRTAVHRLATQAVRTQTSVTVFKPLHTSTDLAVQDEGRMLAKRSGCGGCHRGSKSQAGHSGMEITTTRKGIFSPGIHSQNKSVLQACYGTAITFRPPENKDIITAILLLAEQAPIPRPRQVPHRRHRSQSPGKCRSGSRLQTPYETQQTSFVISNDGAPKLWTHTISS